MKYSIVYSSRTGNTKLLANTIRSSLPEDDCVYFGTPNPKALQAEIIYIGFWTDKGSCDEITAEFLSTVTNQKVFLFGTAGFGENQAYFDKILERAIIGLSKDAKIIGSFMCQGKMPITVRQRYVKILEQDESNLKIQGMINNFDKALTHPDSKDLEELKNLILK